MTDPLALAQRVQLCLAGRSQTLAVAESLTGGMLAQMVTTVPGASVMFRGGVVSYATSVKHEVLGVTAERVISAECASQMASGVRRLLRSDWALSTTGVAGPDRQEDQPVGTAYVGIAGPSGGDAVRLELEGSREEIQIATCAEALGLLLRRL